MLIESLFSNFRDLRGNTTGTLREKWGLDVDTRRGLSTIQAKTLFARNLQENIASCQDFLEVITGEIEPQLVKTFATLDKFLGECNNENAQKQFVFQAADAYKSLIFSLQRAINLIALTVEDAASLGVEAYIATLQKASQEIQRIIKTHTKDLVNNGKISLDSNRFKDGHFMFFREVVQNSLRSWQRGKLSEKHNSAAVMKEWGLPEEIVRNNCQVSTV